MEISPQPKTTEIRGLVVWSAEPGPFGSFARGILN
jgi:hypothetical protein